MLRVSNPFRFTSNDEDDDDNDGSGSGKDDERRAINSSEASWSTSSLRAKIRSALKRRKGRFVNQLDGESYGRATERLGRLREKNAGEKDRRKKEEWRN